jgi:hypothetical protein
MIVKKLKPISEEVIKIIADDCYANITRLKYLSTMLDVSISEIQTDEINDAIDDCIKDIFLIIQDYIEEYVEVPDSQKRRKPELILSNVLQFPIQQA